jgi:hypothetical protein
VSLDLAPLELFFDVEVDFTESTAADGHEVVEYTVKLKGHHKVVSVELTGNKYFTTPALRERMAELPAQFPRYRFGRYSPKLNDRDKEAILAVYRSNKSCVVPVIVRSNGFVAGPFPVCLPAT